MKLNDAIDGFKSRTLKAKDAFDLREVDKNRAYGFVAKYHYLGTAKFMSMYQYGIFLKGTDMLLGVATFSPPQGPFSLKGWFGITDNSVTYIQELTRLCLLPELNGSNATSFLLSNSMKRLKALGVKAVVTLADSARHVGSIYQNCNFRYYGLTDPKQDMYSTLGTNVRGRSSLLHGVWLPRTRKHRYAYVMDPTLKVLYKEEPRPSKADLAGKPSCCGGSLVVHDDRYDEWFTCPKCTSKFIQLTEEEAQDVLKNHNGDSEYVEALISKKQDSDWIW